METLVNSIDDGCRTRICVPLLGVVKIERPRTLITVLFLTSSILVLVVFIVGCVVAASMKIDQSAGSLAFAAVFSAMLCIGLTFFGTVILRKYKTPLSIGVLIGFIFVTANLSLMLCAIFGNIASILPGTEAKRPFQAFATFQFFLFVNYGTFGSTLAVFRDDLIEQAGPHTDEQVQKSESASSPVYS